MNQFNVVGRVTRDVQVRRTGNDKAYVFLTIAVDGYWDKKQKKTVSDFIPVTIWGKEAEKCKSLMKGSLVCIKGRISIGNFTDKQTGKEKYTTDLVGETVQFLAKPKASQNEGEKRYA
ncbi:single-stranded DNA-binding protein [Baia soyae]|uniref:Single-stranded DNA-binding protein n=1 Tax=Baia soyae TaxID=1544746 RepID=A0A4R2RCU2_9BACL|nr:single-stranded DNA-binding protein [Baia soyae]TCP61240.1 single-strand DNA-binding protein [Baia soyae]